MDEFDFGKAIAAREFGMARVLGAHKEFKDQLFAYITNLPHGFGPFLIENIRQIWPPPHPHPNAWGAVTNGLIRRGVIRKAAMDNPTSVKSHGSVVFVYYRT